VKKIFFATLALAATQAMADPTDNTDTNPAPVIVNPNSTYINRQAYIQDPYMGIASGGGTQNVTESQLANQNVWQKWFNDGTYNVMGMAAYATNSGYPSTADSVNIFAQTGQVAGFSFGAMMTVANPWGSPYTTPYTSQQVQILPVNQIIQPTELFAEYQYSNVFQVDVGRIAINNSPWLSSSYYNNIQVPGVTYQGGLVNINPGGGWLLTGLAFNQAMIAGSPYFTNLTMYNAGFDYSTQTANIINQPSNGTIAFGSTYTGFDNNNTLRMWVYNFQQYANMFYADDTLKLPVNKDLSFNLAAQGGYEHGTGMGDDLISTNSDGSINSTYFGAQASFNYDWFGLALAMNSVMGPSNSYLGGNIVSPYTYEIATDPLYTTSYMMGMVEKAAGSAFKVTPSFSFMDNSLTFAPSAAYYSTVDIPSSQEYDMIITYNVPQVKGLLFTLDGAYLIQPEYTNPFPNVGGPAGGNAYVIQLGTSYLY
jgi:hypothetical protein